MQLIDKNALNMHLADVQLANRGWKDDLCEILDDIMQMVDDMPTVDAVPVVRCKDCVHNNGPLEFGDLQCGIHDIPMNNDDFCSYGERRGEG